jgi:hypothetical protein
MKRVNLMIKRDNAQTLDDNTLSILFKLTVVHSCSLFLSPAKSLVIRLVRAGVLLLLSRQR